MKLLTSSPKIEKNDIDGRYLSAIMYLWPGGEKICPSASKGCLASCLVTSGMGRFDAVKAARKARRKFWLTQRDAFIRQLNTEISAHCRKASRLDRIPLIRLNGTSDIDWDHYIPMDVWGGEFGAIFYDYTKVPQRYQVYIDGKLPSNYHLVFSRSEENFEIAAKFWHGGHTIVKVCSPTLKAKWLSDYATCVDGDLNDLAFEHPKGSIILLKEKGRAKKDKTGFVLRQR
jgi:hypothetical protein